MKPRLLLPVLSSTLLLLGGCIGGSGQSRVEALFDPAAGVVPIPSDILFLTSMDGTLSAPVDDPADVTDLAVQLNALDGWSTSASFTLNFESEVDASTATPGAAVRIFEVVSDTTYVPRGGGVTGVVAELTSEDFDVVAADEDATGATLRVLPLKPFKASTSYMVVLTTELRGAKGRPVAASQFFFQAANTTPVPTDILRIAVKSMVDAAQAAGVARPSIVMANTFTTQSIGATLDALYQVSQGGEQALLDGLVAGGLLDTSGGTTASITGATAVVDGGPFPSLGGIADIYTGGLTVPYFLTAASNSSSTDPVFDPRPNLQWWNSRFPFALASGTDTDSHLTAFNPLPEMRSTEEIPMLISIPKGPPPTAATTWPVVIFQHGITADRSNLLAIADILAMAGFASVAIDLPLHGLDSTSGFFTGYLDGGRRERTFGLDLWNNLDGTFGPDGSIDGSGSSFINLGLPIVSRDNIRQAVSDLFQLTSVLGEIDVDNDGSPDLDADAVYFVGHSLGGIVGTTYLRWAEDVRAASLGMPGGGIPKLLEGSFAFGPVVTAGLEGAGLVQGTPEWESFFTVAQTLLDCGDPINHAALGLNPARPTHFIEVVGDDINYPDLVVPNSVVGAPLSGSDPLIEQLGLDIITTTTAAAGGVRGAVRFSEGSHSSLLDPTGFPAAWTEMQGQVAMFFASDGTAIMISNSDVISED